MLFHLTLNRFSLLLILLIAVPAADAQQRRVTPEMVKQEFRHAWSAYRQYAWGHDVLKPLSKTHRDWHREPLLMTPVDAFSTMKIMGLDDEARDAKNLILGKLSFDQDFEVQSFEITIRLLGGLLSAYQLDGDDRFLALAEDLGRRLMPVFDSPTGMPYRYVNLRTGATRDSINNPAEIGTALVEFGTLSRLTGTARYYERAKRALTAVYERRSPIGLVGTLINVDSGEWVDSTSHIGGMIDSYYEYLWKCWRLFGDEDCRKMYETSMTAVNRYVADTVRGGLWYGQVNMTTGRRTGTKFGSLEAFLPGLLVMAGDTARAEQLQRSCFAMWNLHGIEPEEMDYAAMKVTDARYILRPEIIESAYYLRHYTGDTVYNRMGETFFRNLQEYCRADAGYAALKNVETKEQMDNMDSFFLAETLKYLYLLLSPDDEFDFDQYTFNTEAHPIRNFR